MHPGAATVTRRRTDVSSLGKKTLDEKTILMTRRVTPTPRGRYGIDAPYAPTFMAVVAALGLDWYRDRHQAGASDLRRSR